MVKNEDIEFVKIILYYEDKVYKSEKLDMNDDKIVALVDRLNKSGLNNITVLSFLKNEYNKIIFSESVLKKSIVELKIYTKRKKKKKKIKMINS